VSPETEGIIAVLRAIPPGRVATYAQVAAAAGLRNGARQVARILHSSSKTRDLPWFRVIKSDGHIALPQGGGLELQRELLRAEGILVSDQGTVDLRHYRATLDLIP